MMMKTILRSMRTHPSSLLILFFINHQWKLRIHMLMILMMIPSRMLRNQSWTGLPIRALPVETLRMLFNKPVRNKEKIKEWKLIWAQSMETNVLLFSKEEENQWTLVFEFSQPLNLWYLIFFLSLFPILHFFPDYLN